MGLSEADVNGKNAAMIKTAKTPKKHALDSDGFASIIDNRSMKDKMVLITSTKGGQNEHR
jgi:hypothetical protein